MDQDERQRKLEAGRAKLASFRQQRAKGNGAVAQKKTSKRKGQNVQENDRSAQDSRLEESQSNHSHGQDNREDSEERVQHDGAGADPVTCEWEGEMDRTDAQESSSPPGGKVAAVQPVRTEETFGEIIAAHTSKEQLKQLQAAVEKRNEIISQLSVNLQVALMSRDQVQLEAQQLTGQIQELQKQLQQAKEYLRTKCVGWADVCQAQQNQRQLQIEDSQQMTKDQQCLLDQKEMEITALQQKLGLMENSLSQLQSSFSSNNMDQVKSALLRHEELLSESRKNSLDTEALLHKLRTELDEEKRNSKLAWDRAVSLEETVAKLESERSEKEAQLAAVRFELEQAAAVAREAGQYKSEKEQLNRDVACLDGLVQELQSRLQAEVETSKRLSFEHNAEIANYELRLQTLEEEREMNVKQLVEAHEDALKRLRVEYLAEIGHVPELLDRTQNPNNSLCQYGASEEIGASLNWGKAFKEQQNQDTACENADITGPDLDASFTDDRNDMMERYLASAVQHESSLLERSLEERNLMENSAVSNFELNSEVMFAEGQFSDHQHLDADCTDPPLLSETGHEEPPVELEGMSFSQAEWQNCTSVSQEPNESVDGIDLAKELLTQQCRDLTDELDEKERQQEILREEVRRSAEELEEARERWSKASEELEEAKWELEAEREKRLHLEEVVSQKTHEQDNLKNKLSYLESEQEEARMRCNNKTNATLLKELREEKDKLALQLEQKEQLLREFQEQKETSRGFQETYDGQLSSLQVQRDELLVQLQNQAEKNQTMSVLLGQKTLEVDSVNVELQKLQAEMEEKVESVQQLEKAKVDAESELMCLKQNLSNLEEALNQAAVEKTALEERLQTLEEQTKSMENVLEAELENFELLLEARDVDLKQMKEAKEKAEEELMEKERTLHAELGVLRGTLDQHLREQEEEKSRMEEERQKEEQDLNLRLEKELCTLRASLEEEQKKQIIIIKQVHEREHQRALSQQAAQQLEELNQLKAELSEELRDSMEAAHQAELSQAQTQQILELEALRLSLANMHTAQLELSQANLQKEKEAALSELQASLREKWAQESAMLQTRQQFELERVREQGQEQERRVQLQHQQEIDDLKLECEKQISAARMSLEEEQANKLEEAKAQCLQEAERARLELQSSLDETQQQLSKVQTALTKAEAGLAETQTKLEELHKLKEQETKHLETELDQAWADRDSAARAVEELVASHKVVLHEQQTQARSLEEREKRLQQEVDRLLLELETQKDSSDKEISNLWAQLDSMRTSRQELGELKEQLLVRSSRVDDIERLKQEFSQQRRELQEQNEAELENLRTYFEQRLRSSEESHREEIALLQLRLVEGALEESVLKTGESSFLSEEKAEEERADAMAEITEQLEKHQAELDVLRLQLEEKHQQDLEQLRCSMALSYKEELLQARAELTDRYYSDIEQLNTKHALEIEQLRAKLSDNHIKEITKLRLQSAADAARQVEEELQERGRLQNQEHQARLARLESEAERILNLEKRLAELTLQHGLELERATTQHTEELTELEDLLQKNFKEDLRLRLEEERSCFLEEQTRLREQLGAQAEEELLSLREELQRAMEDRQELEQKLAQTQDHLTMEREQLQNLQASLESEESPQLVAVKQKLQAQYDSELRTAKSTMAAEVKKLNALLQDQAESRLKEALCRHQEEQSQLEKKLAKQRESDLEEQKQLHIREMEAQKALLEEHISKLQHLEKESEELKMRHQDERHSLSASHKAALEKHQAELDKLQTVFQETNLAQLEAQEAELMARHKQDLDELESRMLCNMDTLESTYLKEIQAVQEEKEAGLQELQASLEQRHAREMERAREEEQSQREELAQVRCSAMATELRQAHQEEISASLASQKAALEADHCSALETLQQRVLEVEKLHGAALQEITEMTAAEKERLQQQLDTLIAQHQQQLQELRGASAREIEALRRELEEEASRQRLHFLEEAELLKCQSEEQQQKAVALMKEDAEQEKSIALQEQEKRLHEEHQQTELGYKDKMSQLTAQLQQLDTVVSQLRAEVNSLQEELEGKRSEMGTLETLLQRRERESQEGANLLDILRGDLKKTTQQREELQLAQDQLHHILLDMLQIIKGTEKQITSRLGACIMNNKSGDDPSGNQMPRGGGDSQEPAEEESRDLLGEPDCTVFSPATDEGLEMSHGLCESLVTGSVGEVDLKQTEIVLCTCTRLRSSVKKLLNLLVESTQKLEQARALQAVLSECFGEGEEARNVLRLVGQLDEEASVKCQLQLKLHMADGLLGGYVAEKAALEEALQEKEEREQRLVKELESTRAQLHDLSEDHALLQRQRDALTAGLGDVEKALLAETERLGQERMDVQRQAEKDRGGLEAQLRMLEVALEEQESRGQQLEEQHRVKTEDLQQLTQVLEKQLKHNRQFINEQAVEREHERDEFQQEIKNLEAKLRLSSQVHLAGEGSGQRIEDLVMQVESLQAAIKDKTDDYSALLSAKEQYQRDLEERDEEIDKMASRIRDLEQALLSSAEAGQKATLLEAELQGARRSLQELSQDKEALLQQLYSNKLQISALQSKLDETRHRVPEPTPDQNLESQKLEMLQQEIHNKQEQVEALLSRVEELEKALAAGEESMRQLELSRTREQQLQRHITVLQDTVMTLRKQQEEVGENTALQLSAAMLEEKAKEVEHLSEQIIHLQQELDIAKTNRVEEEKQAEVEELLTQVERLRGDQERLRQAKEEEVEQLHEVIHKLQEELNQLDPNLHEVSDPSPEPPDFPEESLCHELNSQSLHATRAKLAQLQAELERSAEKREALQRLLLSQEEQYGQQLATLGRTLGEERGRLTLLEEETAELKVQFGREEAETKQLRARVRDLENVERTLRASRTDLELRLTKTEEGKEEARTELARLGEEVQRQQEERERLEVLVATKDEEMQRCRANVSALVEGNKELKKREGRLQEEIERLEQEVKAISKHIQKLSGQLEERETHEEVLACWKREERLQEELEKLGQEVSSSSSKQHGAYKEVLETLTKAGAALREREEQLARLKVENGALRAELAAVKEGLNTSTERAEKLQEKGQTKDRALADLEVHNQRLRAELRALQDVLEVQEEELAYQQRELEQLRQRLGPKHEHRFLEGVSSEASLSSPEPLRRLDYSEERHSQIHQSHLSELSGLREATLELGTKPSPMEWGGKKTECPSILHSETDLVSTCSNVTTPRSLSVPEDLSVLDSLEAEKVQELENLDVTPSRSPLSTNSPISATEWASDGYGSNVSSEVEAKLNQELENTEQLDANFVAYLQGRGIALSLHPEDTADNLHRDQELLSPELQTMLKRVYQESCRVLSLSLRTAPAGRPYPGSEEAPPPSWQQERRSLQEMVLSLKDLLCRMSEREIKAGDVDWRRELLQTVQSVFNSEREWFHTQFQSLVSTGSGADHKGLLIPVEQLLQKQEERHRSFLEQLLSGDRGSLLVEIQSMHEQLQDLQNSLLAVREQGTQTQRQLQEQVEELEKQLQQEQTQGRDLQRSLEEEQTHSTEQSVQLEAERKAVLELKVEVEEAVMKLQLASKSQEELQNQIHTLRRKLEDEELEHQTCVESVAREQARVKQLQEELHGERLHNQQALEQSTQAQESLRESLTAQLTQQRSIVSSLRSELQIAQSRCETLINQEHKQQEELKRLKTVLEDLETRQVEVGHSLEAERRRSAQLQKELDASKEEMRAVCSQHLEEEQKQARAQEAARVHERKFMQELRAQLEQERHQASDLAAMVERLRGQELQGRRRWEEEMQKEQDQVKQLKTTLEFLQTQRVEVSRNLEVERQKSERLQMELDAAREKMRAVEEQRRHEGAEQEDTARRPENLALHKSLSKQTSCLSPLQMERCPERHQQQEEAKRSRTALENLLAHPEKSSCLVERTLKENSQLAERLAVLSEEKISLKHAVSCLERDLHNLKRTVQEKSPLQSDVSVVREKLAWQKEKIALQAALYKAEAELSKATASNENRPLTDHSNHKMQRLYEKYLRAESYRKSLVYQKRYMLLLLGGYQDCEQATLALIARMGAQSDPNLEQVSKPLSRFRSLVRVLIAISRMKFLTRKWQRATRKNSLGGTTAGAAIRTEVLKPQQPGATYNSPPTRDHVFTQRAVISSLVPPIKSPFRLNRGYSSSILAPSECSLTPSQEQERSLTEYIQHLETVQHRLGAVRPVPREQRRQSLPNMTGQWHKWLLENRTHLYLSCLSPGPMWPSGSPSVLSYPRKSDR